MANEQLMAMLAKSKAVMNKVESGDYSAGNIDKSSIMDSDNCVATAPGMSSQGPGGYITEKEGRPGVAAKNLPPEIQKLMMDHPIPVMNPMNVMQAFTAEDVAPLLETIKRDQQPRVNNQEPPVIQPSFDKIPNVGASKKIDEVYTNNSDYVLISKSELKNTINEALLSFMSTFSQNLTENTIKNTITTLVREGKLGIRKKT
jgi:hypothetical protein